jgi:hypothetical protein
MYTFEEDVGAVEKVFGVEEGFEVLLEVLGTFLVPFVHGRK